MAKPTDWITWPSLDRTADVGLLVLRGGLGSMMAFVHGWPKVAAGPEVWAKLGGAMASVGIGFGHDFFGAAAAFVELFGGLLLVVGLATRPAAALLVVTMAVAAANHLAMGDGLGGASHAIEDGIAFAALILLGPGRYSLDARLKS
ncbi:MAG: DoxX family protein [Myxococcota bacterium]